MKYLQNVHKSSSCLQKQFAYAEEAQYTRWKK